jgi:Protein of unknown function (DUF3810)
LIKEFLCPTAGKYTFILNFMAMRGRKTVYWGIFLLVLIVIIKIFSADAERVEFWYSARFFPWITGILRNIFGHFSFSLGDLLYAVAAGWIIYKLYRLLLFVVKTRQKQQLPTKIKKNVFTLLVAAALVYIVFNLFWGINYNRKGIAWQLGLSEMQYTTSELKNLNCMLIDKINISKGALLKNKTAYYSKRELFEAVSHTYQRLGKQYPYLEYEVPSIKSSMWGWFGNYAGFSGYYNPFSGEAQVNTTVPKFLHPYIACHEVAHQLGYAKEMEANFVGYLAATVSSDTLFHYSVYLDLFVYANRNLFMVDSSAARLYTKELIAPVQNDLKEWFLFSKKHRSILGPVVKWGYGIFLRNNEQPQGMLSYDEVTGFLLAYYKKFGKI